MVEKYSFCESVTATGISPWCVRQLTDEGQKLTGGVDTNSLCGRVKSPYGWDLDVPVNIHAPSICPKCQKLLRERKQKE